VTETVQPLAHGVVVRIGFGTGPVGTAVTRTASKCLCAGHEPTLGVALPLNDSISPGGTSTDLPLTGGKGSEGPFEWLGRPGHPSWQKQRRPLPGSV